MTGSATSCRQCSAQTKCRPYLAGWLCVTCAPPEPPKPDPATTLAGMRRISGATPTTTMLDDRAIASGKRRSNPAAYRAARTAEERRRRA